MYKNALLTFFSTIVIIYIHNQMLPTLQYQEKLSFDRAILIAIISTSVYIGAHIGINILKKKREEKKQNKNNDEQKTP